MRELNTCMRKIMLFFGVSSFCVICCSCFGWVSLFLASLSVIFLLFSNATISASLKCCCTSFKRFSASAYVWVSPQVYLYHQFSEKCVTG